MEARLANQDELESLISQWTSGLTPGEVVSTLQSVGVPAAPVLDSAEVMEDPHLRERGFVVEAEHSVAGRRPVLNLPWAVDGQRGDTLRPAPNFGQHNDWVLKELLSMPDDEYDRLHVSGAVG